MLVILGMLVILILLVILVRMDDFKLEGGWMV